MTATSQPAPTGTTTPPGDPAAGRPVPEDDDLCPQDLIVVVDGRLYAIPVGQVREVIRPVGITRVPGAPRSVLGIVNVRGAVVTLLDLAALLTGVRAVTAGSIVLIEHGPRLVGLAVQTVRDVRATGAAADAADVRANREDVVPLDAVALCARHLLSSEEVGQ